jgi:hypothetical protein
VDISVKFIADRCENGRQLDGIVDLEEKRQSETIWTPAQHLLRWNAKPVVSEKDFEEDPGPCGALVARAV